ncbi:MAG: response regulator transcription factor [Acidimicrobiales bacterium]|nr:response regulator transcription factor [Acidimicrobiales bacterium]
MTVLIVEDDLGISSFIRKGLQAEGYVTHEVATGAGAIDAVKRLGQGIDLVLLDLMLPDEDGIEVLRSIRKMKPALPVIISSARGETKDKVLGLDAGANDYIAKPFAFDELLARIRAALRSGAQASATEIIYGNLKFDLLTKTAWRLNKRVDLSQREWSLLEYFLRHPNQVVSRIQIMDQVWDYGFDTGSNVVDVYVGYLRRKLDIQGEESIFRSIRGAGYRFVPPIGPAS